MDSNLVSKFLDMKQPDLGLLIAELRKKKGLTQEELVEKCNINVRTIQRIEAGEVNPRSYTIKNILEALEAEEKLLRDEELDNPKNSAEPQTDVKDDRSLNLSRIKTGIVCGIMNLILFVPLFIVGVWGTVDDVNIISWTFYALLVIASFFMFYYFLSGIAELASLHGKTSLSSVVNRVKYLWIIVSALDILLFTVPEIDSIGFWLLFILYLAAYLSISIYLYYNIFDDGKIISNDMRNAGISGLIACILMFTVVLSPLSFIPVVISHILLLTLLNKSFKNYSQLQSNTANPIA